MDPDRETPRHASVSFDRALPSARGTNLAKDPNGVPRNELTRHLFLEVWIVTAQARWTSRLAVGLVLAALVAAPARAQDPNYVAERTSVPLPPTVTFSVLPSWELVKGTHVSVLRDDQRQPFDMFAFENQYYLYNKGYWYRAAQVNGPYLSVEPNELPAEFLNVPRERWVSYPDAWSSDVGNGGVSTTTVGTNRTPTVSFSTAPHWVAIPNTRVYRVRASERPGFDLFRYESRYYVYQDGNWYQAPTANGTYVEVAIGEIPYAIRMVRPNYWVSYPPSWAEENAKMQKNKHKQ
jgi:hypothetical protein